MSELTDEMAAMAAELLAEEGVPCTLTPTSKTAMTGSGDRAPTAVALPVQGIILPNKGNVKKDGVDVASERVICTSCGQFPQPGWKVVINGRSLVVDENGARTYAPTGGIIIHDLLVVSE